MDLLCGTEKYTQYFIITCKGRDSSVYIYIHIYMYIHTHTHFRYLYIEIYIFRCIYNIYIWISMLYTWSQHDIVNQRYFSFLKIQILGATHRDSDSVALRTGKSWTRTCILSISPGDADVARWALTSPFFLEALLPHFSLPMATPNPSILFSTGCRQVLPALERLTWPRDSLITNEVKSHKPSRIPTEKAQRGSNTWLPRAK